MIAIISTAHGRGSGAEVILECLLRGAQNLSMPLCLVAPPDSAVFNVATCLGIRVLPLLTSCDRLIENTFSVFRLMDKLRDSRLVHAWHARGFEQAWWLGRKLGIPSVGTLHDHPAASFHGHVRRQIMKSSANNLQGLVCVSQAVLEVCKSFGYKGHLTIIRNGILDQEKNNTSTKHQNKRVNIGFLGMNAPLKGFNVVEQWIRRGVLKDIEWHFYGEIAPVFVASLKQLEREFNEEILFEGRRSTKEIFSKIDILVHPSIEFDAFPTVLLEAARAGIPSIACNIGGAPEIVDHGRTGFVFDLEKPDEGLKLLQLLISDRLMRENFGLAARRRFEDKFKVARMVDEYNGYWRDIMNLQSNKGIKCL
ncbi:MAG: glycosyltransferase family 4 protein [Kiritimatiellae bacterium]|nr:glycosyltransferase family 4 protein [Kiritimatiellia bacterium]MDD5523061.1 glycosyltransferase family 4 protein [Kiritimatiellia bacterium]